MAVAAYSMPVGQALLAGTEGAAFGFFPILWIVINAIWIYNMTVVTGHFDVLRRSFARVSDDQRIQAVIIAFCFGALLEALAGFGTPVAITTVMLIAFGFRPIKAAAVALVANTAPVAFGAMATPITTLAAVTGLPERRPRAMVGRQTPILAMFVPLALVFIIDGRRGVGDVARRRWPAGVAFGVAQFVTSNYSPSRSPTSSRRSSRRSCVVLLLRVWQPGETLGGSEPTRSSPEGRPTSRRRSSPVASRTRTRVARSYGPSRRTRSSSWSSSSRRSPRSRAGSTSRPRSSTGPGCTSRRLGEASTLPHVQVQLAERGRDPAADLGRDHRSR